MQGTRLAQLDIISFVKVMVAALTNLGSATK